MDLNQYAIVAENFLPETNRILLGVDLLQVSRSSIHFACDIKPVKAPFVVEEFPAAKFSLILGPS